MAQVSKSNTAITSTHVYVIILLLVAILGILLYILLMPDSALAGRKWA